MSTVSGLITVLQEAAEPGRTINAFPRNDSIRGRLVSVSSVARSVSGSEEDGEKSWLQDMPWPRAVDSDLPRPAAGAFELPRIPGSGVPALDFAFNGAPPHRT